MDVQANCAVFGGFFLALAAGLLPAPGSGQIFLDQPFRADVAPEALLAGAAATLWNPAGVSMAPGGAWLVSVDGPEATEITGVAAAVTVPLARLGTLGVGFSHLGIEDIPRTLDSPAPEPGDIDVAEDAAALVLGWRVAPWARIGLGGRWTRASVLGVGRARTTASLGVYLSPRARFRPRVAVSVTDLGGDERLLAGLSASLPPAWTGPFQVGMGYGIDSWARTDALEQRVSLELTWLSRLRAAVGLRLPDEDVDGVVPLWMAAAEFGPYSLAVLREGLPNDFGAVHYYRAAIRF